MADDDAPVVVLLAEQIARGPMLAEAIRRGNAQALAQAGSVLIHAAGHLAQGGQFNEDIVDTLRRTLDVARYLIDSHE